MALDNNNEYSISEKSRDVIYHPRVVVKFKDEIQLPYIDDVEEYLEKIGPWSELQERFPGIEMSRLFKTVEPDRIEELVARAVARARKYGSIYEPPNFLTYFVVDYVGGKNPAALARALSDWKSVAEAYVVPKPAPPPIADGIRDFQNYLNPAKEGINAQYGWATPGGHGDDIRFIDMEKGWYLGHPGLPTGITLIPQPGGGDNREYKGHGAAVLGIVLAQDPGTHCKCGTGVDCACTGIAKNAITNLVSEFRTTSDPYPDKADAITAAMDFLMSMAPEEYEGSVLLLESQSNLARVDPGEDESDPADDFEFFPDEGYAPIEVYTAEFHAIELATNNGIAVIEPAGNAVKENSGAYLAPVNLDTLEKRSVGTTTGKKILNPPSNSDFRPSPPNSDFQRSGAIMVGAATWKVEHQRTQSPPLDSSNTTGPGGLVSVFAGPPTNFGKRIDCYAWGEYVKTTGSGIDNESDIWTWSFSGTSSASAIIAGVALVVQGIAKANGLGSNSNGTYSPAELREILGSFDPLTNQPWRRSPPDDDPPYGTKSNSPMTDLIGVMPDLKKIINDRMGLESDIFLRDFVGSPSLGDDIGDPHTGPISSSPDIIVRNAQVENYDDVFGETSSQRDDNGLGELIIRDGNDKYVYVRVTNRDAAPAEDVQVTVYWSEVSTLVTPNTWLASEIGTANLTLIPGKKMKVAEIVWQDTSIPSTGHYCFVGIVGNPRDPAPDPSAISTWNEYHSFIRDYNNVTWCNFNVEEMPPPPSPPGPRVDGGAMEPEPRGGGEGGNGEDEDLVILPFLATGAQFGDFPMQLEVEAQLPEGAQLWVEGREGFLLALQGETADLEGDKEKGIKRVVVRSRGRHSFENIRFPSDLRERMRLVVSIPEESRQRPHEIFVRQLYNREEVGRITWRLVPPDRMRPLAPEA